MISIRFMDVILGVILRGDIIERVPYWVIVKISYD